MKVGITGANGHLGNVLCRRLLESGYTVKALYKNKKDALLDLKLQLVQGDILNYYDVKGFVSDCDVIINSAAIISVNGDPTGLVYKTNTDGPKHVVQACIETGVKRLIHISSSHAVMDTPFHMPYDENRAYKSKDSMVYDFSKAEGEKLVLKYAQEGSIDAVVLRPSAIIGLHDYGPSLIGKALLDFYNQKISILPPGGYNCVDVRDVASSIVTAIEKGKTGEVYLLSGHYCLFKDLAKMSNQIAGKKNRKIILPFWFLKLLLPFVKIFSKVMGRAPLMTKGSIEALEFGHPNMMHTKATNELGHNCRPLEDSLRDFYQWHQERNTIV